MSTMQTQRQQAQPRQAQQQQPQAQRMGFEQVGPPLTGDQGSQVRVFEAKMPHGKLVWISRTHVNAASKAVSISDALAFVPNEV